MVGTSAVPIPGFERRSGTIANEKAPCPSPTRIGYRAFDRQYLIPDNRLIDRPRPALWQVVGDRQVFAIEQHDEPLTAGPGIVFASDVPDIHFFNGRGGRVLPLYRDSAGMAPNIAPGLLNVIARRLGVSASPEEFLAYVAGVTSHHGYTAGFANELKTPGDTRAIDLLTPDFGQRQPTWADGSPLAAHLRPEVHRSRRRSQLRGA